MLHLVISQFFPREHVFDEWQLLALDRSELHPPPVVTSLRIFRASSVQHVDINWPVPIAFGVCNLLLILHDGCDFVQTVVDLSRRVNL